MRIIESTLVLVAYVLNREEEDNSVQSNEFKVGAHTHLEVDFEDNILMLAANLELIEGLNKHIQRKK
jgi:hypothetical protein